MRRYFILAIIFFGFKASFASVPFIFPPVKANEIFISLKKSGQEISLQELSRIRIKDLERLSRVKMNLFDRIRFRIVQKKLRDNINPDGTLRNNKLITSFSNYKKSGGGGLGGFALGSLLGPLGILIAYLSKDDQKKMRVKWAWVGLLAFIPLWVLIFIIALSISGGSL